MSLKTWRILLPRLADLPMDLDEELFQALLELEEKQSQQPFRWEEASSWSMNKNDGTLMLFFDDGTTVKARMQVLGIYDGDSFTWSWADSSLADNLKKDALALKEHGDQNGWQFFSEPAFVAVPRDGYALAALAASLYGYEGAYAGASGGTVTYFTLNELIEITDPGIDQPQFEPPSALKNLTGLLVDQVSIVQLSLSDLREVENVCRRAQVLSFSGDNLAAAEALDEAWEMLGGNAGEQEPSGWIKLAKGNALFICGKIEEALAALLEADELPGCPDLSLLYCRTGQCYAALGNKKRASDMFAKLYVAAGSQGLAQLSDAENELFAEDLKKRCRKKDKAIAARMSRHEKAGEQETVVATVACLINEMHAFELDAHKEQEKARKCQEMSMQLCGEEMDAREKINTCWSWLMAVWCTPQRSPRCNNIQYPPCHDPKNEKPERIWRTDGGLIALETTAEDAFGCPSKWRYELEEVEGSLLVKQIYSVWDDEEFSSI